MKKVLSNPKNCCMLCRIPFLETKPPCLCLHYTTSRLEYNISDPSSTILRRKSTLALFIQKSVTAFFHMSCFRSHRNSTYIATGAEWTGCVVAVRVTSTSLPTKDVFCPLHVMSGFNTQTFGNQRARSYKQCTN